MPTPRTTGMTAIGILNIVFGSLGCFMIVSSMAGQSSGSAGSGTPALLLAVLGLACWALMAVSGWGLLKSAPWSGKFAKLATVGVLATIVLTILTSGFTFNAFTIAAIGYCCALLYMCMTPQWKSTFGTQSHAATPSMPHASTPPSQNYDQYRDAA